MFDFSVFPMGFRMRPQNCTSRFHNFSYRSPILKWDTSMSLWGNSLMVYIKMLLLNGGPIFNPFSCSIYPYFQWVSE